MWIVKIEHKDKEKGITDITISNTNTTIGLHSEILKIVGMFMNIHEVENIQLYWKDVP